MKKITLALSALLIAASTCYMSCKPKALTDDIDIAAAIPDVKDFLIEAAQFFAEGTAAIFTIASSSLGDGEFTVYYDLTGANAMSNLEAVLKMSGGKGTFKTPTLANAGDMNVKINAIGNSEGGKANVTTNNYKSFTDSNGYMKYTYGGKSYIARHLYASVTGSTLVVDGTIWNPLSGVTLRVHTYANAPIVCNFKSGDLPAKGTVAFSRPGIAELGQYGTINITSITPLITGTFTFTATDSTKVTEGSFSCPAP